jgi:Flp pilus assembly protein CpaB
LGPGTGTADETQTAPDVAFIVIAAQDIPRGGEIVPDAVVSAPFPADSVVETMLTDPAQAVGFRARMDIARGLPITENMLTKEPGDLLGSGSEASIAIRAGRRRSPFRSPACRRWPMPSVPGTVSTYWRPS